MNAINIGTLIEILRNLDNQITAAKLSADLDVSTSTLARCKTGKWSHSITLKALKNAFDMYKHEFFENDEDKMCMEILRILKANLIPTDNYEIILKNQGFDAFISSLLDDAYQFEKQNIVYKSTPVSDGSDKQSFTSDTESPKHQEEECPSINEGVSKKSAISVYMANNWFSLFLWLSAFLIFAITMNLNDIKISQLYLFLISLNPATFSVILLLLAFSRVLTGRFIDTPIAVKRFKKRTGRTDISPESYFYISKYGSDTEIIPGEGRFNCEEKHMQYALVCNITSCMCAVSFFMLFNGSMQYFSMPPQQFSSPVLGITLILSVVCTFVYNFFEQTSGCPSELDSTQENQDNYRLDRVNVFFNNIFLMLSLFFILSSLIFFVYGVFINSTERIDIHPAYLLILITGYLFFWFSSVSPYAIDYNSTCAGTFITGPVFLIILSIICMVFRFKPSIYTVFLILITLTILVTWIYTIIFHKKHEYHKLNRAYKRSTIAAILILVIILFMIIKMTVSV